MVFILIQYKASTCPSSARAQFRFKSRRIPCAQGRTQRDAQGAIGYLGSVTDPSGTTSYERDSLGRTTRKTQTLSNGNTRSIGYQYDASGLLSATTYPGGQTLQYQRDTTGQITALVWAGQPIVQNITWTPLGQPQSWQWTLSGAAIGLPGSRSYNSAGQTTQTETTSQQYDSAGRIQSLTQNLWQPADTDSSHSTLAQSPATWSASYDRAGRLSALTKTSPSGHAQDSTTYQYDANGNLTSSQRERAGTTTTRSYRTESSHNKLLGFEQTTRSASASASTSVTHQYDAAGNLQTDGLHHYHYDSQGRLQSSQTGQGADAPTTRYAHNALGQRVFKTEPLFAAASGKDSALDDAEEDPSLLQTLVDFFTRLWNPAKSDAEHLGWAYVYDEDGSLLGEYGMGGAQSAGQSQYLYLPTSQGPIPMAAEIDGHPYAIHTDHLGTPRRLTQADGQAAWQWAYSAYGDEAPTLGAKRFTNETTNPTTGATNIPPVRFNLRYPGQYFDAESGLHYNYFRSYDPRTGRYTQFDPIGLDGGPNGFAYVEGNPLSYTDPMGLQTMPVPPVIPIPGVPNPILDAQRNLADRLSRAFRDNEEITYQTYTRYNPLTGDCYSGRTSGTDTPENNIRNRGYGQPLLNAEGFLPPVLDRSSTNYNAIRGREQQLIDVNGGAQSSGGTSRNKINGISPINPRGPFVYIPAATAEFGVPVPAGKCTCQ